MLSGIEFQSATRKDRPKLEEGVLIYCRILKASKYGKTTLSCISPINKKSWNSGEAFFKPLIGGFVKNFPIGFCRQLLS
jgi:exosome complex component RRP40